MILFGQRPAYRRGCAAVIGAAAFPGAILDTPKRTGRARRGRPQRSRFSSAMAAMTVDNMPATAVRAAGLLAAAAHYGAAGCAQLALVPKQARGDLGAIRDRVVAEPVGVALASILRVLRAGVVGALRQCRRQRAKHREQRGHGKRLE